MYYPEELKLKVVSEVLNKQLTQTEARRKYSILGHSTICKWIKKYGYLFDHLNNNSNEVTMKQKDEKINQYEERITKLEKLLAQKELELEDEKLKARLYKRMINLAEEKFNIKIKKNSGQ
jgi:transposase-like protein